MTARIIHLVEARMSRYSECGLDLHINHGSARTVDRRSVTCPLCIVKRHRPGADCPACRSANITATPGKTPESKPFGHCLDCGHRWTIGGRRNHRGGKRVRRKPGSAATLDQSNQQPSTEERNP